MCVLFLGKFNGEKVRIGDMYSVLGCDCVHDDMDYITKCMDEYILHKDDIVPDYYIIERCDKHEEDVLYYVLQDRILCKHFLNENQKISLSDFIRLQIRYREIAECIDGYCDQSDLFDEEYKKMCEFADMSADMITSCDDIILREVFNHGGNCFGVYDRDDILELLSDVDYHLGENVTDFLMDI